MKSYYIIPIFVPHEGCPHDCVFCNQGKITGENKQDVNGPKNKIENSVNRDFVIKTVEEYLKTINTDSSVIEISFFGGTFTAIDIDKQRELLSVAKDYKEKGIIDYIRLSTRPDCIDDFILNHLKEHSVDIIELGVQSLDSEVLEKSGRGHGVEEVERASKLINDYGFILGHQIMIGLPGDSKEKDIYTAKMSIEMKPDICRIYPALTIKNTPMEDMYLKNIYKPYTLEEAINICEEIYNLYKKANIKVIRIGLQPTDNIAEGKDVIAGPFHPAFRELVESKSLNEKIYSIFSKNKGDIVIRINNRRISKLYAGKKMFFNELKDKVNSNSLNVILDDNIELNSVLIDINNELYKICI